jgi:hypothetical protein
MQLSIQTKQQGKLFCFLNNFQNMSGDVRKPVAKLLKSMAFRSAGL